MLGQEREREREEGRKGGGDFRKWLAFRLGGLLLST